MSLDGKILARAKKRLDERRLAAEHDLEDRRRLAYARAPQLEEVETALKATVIDAIGVAMRKGEDPVEAMERIKDRNLDLQENRAMLLTKAGLPADYLSAGYICPKCRDTGYNGTELCSCLMDLYREEQTRELSQLLKLGEETFDTFSLDYYSDEYDPSIRKSPRAVMQGVFDYCLEYARKFSPKSPNLFLSGGTGLGKTFLSTSIAKVVAEGGFSVVYDTAASVFSQYERDKFDRSADLTQVRADIRRMESCDLLIIDDLGTEMPGAFVTSALYTLLNTRLTAKKKLVINSNLAMEELARRYSPAIMSRLEGEFTVLRFYGRDIRRIKNGW